MLRDTVNEGETAYLSVAFKDKTGQLDTPTTVSFRIDCLTNNQEVRADTTVAPAPEVEITLPPSDHAIIDSANNNEHRLVTVTATYGTDDAIVREFDYNLKNMRKKP